MKSDRINELAARGYKPAEIAQMIGCSLDYVGVALRRQKTQRKIWERINARVAALHVKGLHNGAIAQKLRLSRGQVIASLYRQNLGAHPDPTGNGHGGNRRKGIYAGRSSATHAGALGCYDGPPIWIDGADDHENCHAVPSHDALLNLLRAKHPKGHVDALTRPDYAPIPFRPAVASYCGNGAEMCAP